MRTSTWNQLAKAIAFISAVLCVYAVRQVDADFWGYLDAGRLFATQGLTHTDPFAYTSAHSPWITFEYGAELALWWAYRYGGTLGLLALKGLLGGACLACVYATFRAVDTRTSTWLPLFLLTASGVSRFFLFRPQLFTFALFAAFVLILFRHALGKRSALWCLPLGTALWVNTHGGFVAGLAAIGLTIALETAGALHALGWQPQAIVRRTRALWIALGCSVVATFANPLGPRVWVYVLTELTHGTNRRYIREWAPATFQNDAWSTWVLIVIALSLSLAAIAALLLGRATSRRAIGAPPLMWALTGVPLLVMAAQSVRHTPLAAIWAGPVIALLAAEVADELASRAIFRQAWFVLRGLAVVPVMLTVFVVSSTPAPRIRTDGAILGRTHPCRAVGSLRATGVKAHLYTPLWWGSYVTWHLYPSVQVAMDGRNISLFPDTMVEENLRFYTRPAPDVDPGVPLRYDTDLLLVPTDSPAIARVRGDARWRELYGDSDAAVFSRTDRPSVLAALRLDPAPSTSCPAYFQ